MIWICSSCRKKLILQKKIAKNVLKAMNFINNKIKKEAFFKSYLILAGQ
jgi:hypothetical protein